MKILKHCLYLVLSFGLLCTACSTDATIPQNATSISEAVHIYPDYRDVTIPANIAPMNIQVKSAGNDFIAHICGLKGEIVAEADEKGKFRFDADEWHKLLANNPNADLTVTIYARREGKWVKHPAYKLHVAEPIDRFLSYRLVEPGYELYRQLGLYQRDMTSFTQRPIYENNRQYDTINNHCVNCHNYQAYDTRRMLFHVRASHGGTVIVENGKVRKWNMKCDSILSSTVYPSWHPTRNWVVFSTNQTGQAFHVRGKEKIEVMDYGSDLVFFDADAGTLTNILKTDADLETFPCWAPDGRKLYYCSAHVPAFEGKTSDERQDLVTSLSDSIRYNVMSMTFDPVNRRFGKPVVEVDCASMKRSASVPRVSPDGRYVLFTMGDYGQFHIWHDSADLYVKDLQTGNVRCLSAASAPGAADSYHTWSSNGRWIVFASRRDDGSYSRAYIAYFDKQGRDHKAFLLPQENPEENLLLLKSYNVPELTKNAVLTTPEELKRAIYDDKDARKVTYRPAY